MKHNSWHERRKALMMSQQQLETATVYHVYPNQGYLIAVDTTGNEIFMDVTDGRFIVISKDNKPMFSSQRTLVHDGKRYIPRLPQKGEKLVFQRKRISVDRDRGCPWGYEDHWKCTQQEIEKNQRSHTNTNDLSDNQTQEPSFLDKGSIWEPRPYPNQLDNP